MEQSLLGTTPLLTTSLGPAAAPSGPWGDLGSGSNQQFVGGHREGSGCHISKCSSAHVHAHPPGSPSTPQWMDVFLHQSQLHVEGFWSPKEGEAVEFTFDPSESPTGPGPVGVLHIGSERRPKGMNVQKRRSKGDRCFNRGGLDHHAKDCKLPPQPKKCHFCQSLKHMVASCLLEAQQAPSSQGKPAYFQEDGGEIHSPAQLLEAQN